MKNLNLIFILCLSFSFNSCNPIGDTQVKGDFFKKKGGQISSNVSSVNIVNDQLVLSGVDLHNVTQVQITGPSAFDETFAIESQTGVSLIANGMGTISMALSSAYNLIISTAHGAASFPLSVTISDDSITAIKLSTSGANTGDVFQFDGTNWGLANLNGLTFQGNWDATGSITVDTTDLTQPSCDGKTDGDYLL